MQLDPTENWRQLTGRYAEMLDGELIALAEDFGDLTDMARQILRDEMRKRGLGDPKEYAAKQDGAASAGDGSGGLRAEASAGVEGGSSEEFVWKNVLCDCSDREEAWQIREALRRAGIETWTDGSQSFYTPLPEMGAISPRVRVLVASDQLEDARAILSQPIPPDIVEESKAEEAEFVPPVCPACGAHDPVLEDVDPANSWKCEVCGKQWTEAVAPNGEPPMRS